MANSTFVPLNSSDGYVPTGIRVTLTSIYGFLMLIGMSGNILVILVVFRVKNMLTPTNCYLVSLAVSDFLFLSSAGLIELASLNLPRGVYPVPLLLVCRTMTYLPYLSINVSSMTIAAFTYERYIGICHPIKARYLCTVKRAGITIAVIWTVSLVTNCPWIPLATLKPIQYLDLNASSCTFALERSSWRYKFIYASDFICFYLIPMIFYAIFYGKIAYTLSSGFNPGKWKSSRREAKAAKTIIENVPRQQEDVLHLSAHPSRSPSPQINREGATSSICGANNKRSQVVKMLFVIMSVFAICWLPYRGLVMYNSFARIPWQSEGYIYMAKTLIFINCASNPVLYNLMSARFRQAFYTMLTGNTNRTLDAASTWRAPTRHKRESLRARFASMRARKPARDRGTRQQEMVVLMPRLRKQSSSLRWNTRF